MGKYVVKDINKNGVKDKWEIAKYAQANAAADNSSDTPAKQMGAVVPPVQAPSSLVNPFGQQDVNAMQNRFGGAQVPGSFDRSMPPTPQPTPILQGSQLMDFAAVMGASKQVGKEALKTLSQKLKEKKEEKPQPTRTAVAPAKIYSNAGSTTIYNEDGTEAKGPTPPLLSKEHPGKDGHTGHKKDPVSGENKKVYDDSKKKESLPEDKGTKTQQKNKEVANLLNTRSSKDLKKNKL